MITKERLEELVEQGATIYELDINYNIYPLDLRDYQDVKIEEVEEYSLNRLFETQEEAEWHKEFGNITRTERLELPTWEEFLSKHKCINPIRFYQKNKYISMGRVFPMKSRKIYVSLSYEGCNPSFEWVKPLTKENYILACRKCKELFLGGENEINND